MSWLGDKQRRTKDKASKAFSESRWKDAIKLYEEVIAEDPTELSCRIKLGDIYKRLGQTKEAVTAYQPVAKYYAQDGFLLKAIAVCKLILGVDPAHTATQEMLADLCAKRAGQGRPDVARAAPGVRAPPARDASRHPERRPEPPSVGAKGVEPPRAEVGAGVEPPRAEVRASVEPLRAEVGAGVESPRAEMRAAAPVSGAPSLEEALPSRLKGGAGAPEKREEHSVPRSYSIAWPVSSNAPSLGASSPPASAVGDAGALSPVIRAEPTVLDVDEPLDFADTPPEALRPVAPDPFAVPPAGAFESPGTGSKVGAGAVPSEDLSGVMVPEIPLFSDLPRNAFIEILVQMTMRQLVPGDFVIRQGEIGNSFFVLASGKVRVFRSDEEGAETTLAYLGDGAFFGEMALLEGGPRTASVIVEEESQIFELTKPLLDHVVAQYPVVARVLRNFYTQRLLSTIMATHRLFRPFVAVEQRRLMEKFKSKAFKSGEVIVTEGKKGEGFYLLLTGKLTVTKDVEGEELTVTELSSGDMFGEMSSLTNRPTVASVRAISDCFVLRLSKQDFDELIMTHPQVLELVAEIADKRGADNSALFGAWTPRPRGAALV